MIEKLNPLNNSLIEILPFYKINKRLNNFTTHQIAASIPQDTGKIFDVNFDFEATLLNQIKQELNRCVYNKINNSLRNTTKIGHVDLRKYENKPFGHKVDGLQMCDRVFSYITGCEYKNIITSTKIASDMQDSAQFIFSSSSKTLNIVSNSPLPYYVGKIENTSIWADPYLKYNDDKIVMFDEVEINFDVKNISTMNDCTFSPKVIVEINLCVDSIDSMIVSLIESMSSPSYAEYISIRRELKIDEIIK